MTTEPQSKITEKMNKLDCITAIIECECNHAEIVLLSNKKGTAWDRYKELLEDKRGTRCNDCRKMNIINWNAN